MTDAGFTRFLVNHGLTAAGSTETIEDLQRRYGVQRWFNFLDVTKLPPASLFPEQKEPFFLLADRNCLLPPNAFECDFDYHRHGHKTYACALERLTALFGVPENGIAVNTLAATWRFERMSLSICTFLPEKTRGPNPLYTEHPELWNFCRISIDRNWVRPMTDPVHPDEILPIDSIFRPIPDHLSMWERGLFRWAEGSVTAPFLWRRAADVGWCAGPVSAFFERSRCLGLRLQQVMPARSRGYSRLVLTLNNPFSLKQEPDDTVVLAGKDTHTLDQVAHGVAAFWNIPMKIEEFDAD